MINCKPRRRTWLSVVNHPLRDQRIPSVDHVTELWRTTIVWQIAASKQLPRGPCACSRVCIGHWHLSWLLESLSVGPTGRTMGNPTPLSAKSHTSRTDWARCKTAGENVRENVRTSTLVKYSVGHKIHTSNWTVNFGTLAKWNDLFDLWEIMYYCCYCYRSSISRFLLCNRLLENCHEK